MIRGIAAAVASFELFARVLMMIVIGSITGGIVVGLGGDFTIVGSEEHAHSFLIISILFFCAVRVRMMYEMTTSDGRWTTIILFGDGSKRRARDSSYGESGA